MNIYVVKNFIRKKTKYGKDYLIGQLSNDKGSVDFKVWSETFDDIMDVLQDAHKIKIDEHTVDIYKGKKSLILKKISLVEEKNKIDEEAIKNVFTEGAMVFVSEISFIMDDDIRGFTKKALESAPDYFYTTPASTSGKYHPQFSLGEGGLVRHTKANIMFALELFRNETVCNFDQIEKDIIISALLLHDTVKHGLNGSSHTAYTHPLDAIKYYDEKNIYCLNLEYNETIFKCIASHMGSWNKDRKGNEILPKPQTELEKFVHLCDYLGSRKFININF